MKRFALWGLLVFVMACNEQNEPASSFEALDGTGAFNEYNVVLQTHDGGYLAAGYSISNDDPNQVELPSQAIIAKYNAAGKLIKTTQVAESLLNNLTTGVLLQSGQVVFAGNTKSDRGDMDIMMIKCSDDGDIIWNRVYGERVGEEAFDIEETFDGELVLAGATGSSALYSEEERNGFIWFLSANGQLEDKYMVVTGKESILKDIALLGKTGYFAIGEYTDSVDVFHPFFVSVLTDTIMEFFDSIPGSAESMISVSSDSFLVFGSDSRTGNLVQWQINGLTGHWQRHNVDYSGEIELHKVRRYYGGGYIIAANFSEKGAMYYGIKVQVYQKNGQLKWERTLTGDKTQMLQDIAVTSDSGVVIAGFKDMLDERSQAYLVKLDKNGQLE